MRSNQFPLRSFEVVVRTLMEKYYVGNQSQLNSERVIFLEKDANFKKEIMRIRKLFSVPQLKPDEDRGSFDMGNTIIDDSGWLLGQSQTTQEKLLNEIEALVNRYNLPIHFREWIEGYILYGKSFYKPLYNWELVNEIMNNPRELQRMPLNTQEKNMVKGYVRHKLGIKRRPPKHLAKAYHELITTLSKSKNAVRRNRTLNTALKTLKMGTIQSSIDYALGPRGKVVIHKVTSTDLATSIFNDDTGEKASLVRKQKQRLKARTKKLQARK